MVLKTVCTPNVSKIVIVINYVFYYTTNHKWVRVKNKFFYMYLEVLISWRYFIPFINIKILEMCVYKI